MASSSSSSSPEISNSHHANGRDHFSFKYASQEEVLEDLSSRFILNLPDEELTSVERICFQVEQAHWFYEDFIREENSQYPSLPLKKFSAMLFNACPMLQQWSHDHEQAFNTFMQYKTRVPVCGAIMLNDTWDKCVLVKGWKSSSGWGFPKGKINQDEEKHDCAVREVLEETGYDLSGQINPDDYIEMSIREQLITLYIVGGVPEDYNFHTRTRKEISKIEWFTLANLPTWKRNKQVPGKFYLISPFVPPLKDFINKHKDATRFNTHKNPKVKQIQHVHGVIIRGNQMMNMDFTRGEYAGRTSDVERSSSQSSSADNGDPPTPSPQYNQAQAVPVDTIVEAGLPAESLDPHFARLLTGLSLSAAKPLVEQTLEIPLSSTTPVPTPESFQQYEGSVQEAPRDTAKEPLIVKYGAQPEAPLQASPSLSTLSKASRSPFSAAQRPAISSTEMISHSSPAPAPLVTGRRLKQLALLESVASESSRTSTPTLDHRVPPGISGIHGLPYHPPPSVPPMPFGGLNAGGQFHTNMPCLPGPGPFSHPQVIGHPFPQTSEDPFQVRPRTSNAAFPPTLPMLSHGPRGLSMHQGQLLAMMGNMNGVPPPRPMPSYPHPPFNVGTMPSAGHGHQSLLVMAPLSASRFDPGPLSAPPSSPGFPPARVAHRAVNRANLLSILNPNSNSSPVMGRSNFSSGTPTPNVLPPGVLNGITHR